jgi:hypothetical protein
LLLSRIYTAYREFVPRHPGEMDKKMMKEGKMMMDKGKKMKKEAMK